mgnify:CR=1 FL=1
MKKQITHKQHYVWRKYLETWGESKDNKVFVWWNYHNLVKQTDLFDILRENDFYAFASLNKLELFVLKEMFAKTNNKTIKEANLGVDSFVNLVQEISDVLVDTTEFDEYLIQAGETIQTKIENSGYNHLELLKNENLKQFNYEEDGKMIDFLIFLLFQFLRTKKNKDGAIGSVIQNDSKLKELYKKEMNDQNDYELDWEKVYNFGFIYLVQKSAYYMTTHNAHIKLLKSKNARFIVSDQPVYNIAEDKLNDFDLFYPISPTQAVIVSTKYQENKIEEITDSEVLFYNHLTLKNAYKFVLGVSKEYVNFSWPEF